MIKIIADTTSTISPSDAKSLGIHFMPQMIIFGDKEYRDDYEISTQVFLEKLRASSTLPKTAAPSPALYTPIFKELLEQNHTVLVICPSSKVSGTYRSAIVAAQDFPDANIFIVDTQTIGPALGTLVRKAIDWVSEGVDIQTIVSRLEMLGKSVIIYFYVDTLEYLYKGGRIGAAKALAGSLLQVKPILLFKDGQVNPFESQRTKRKAIARIIELVLEQCPATTESDLSILEADAIADAVSLRAEFSKYFGFNNIRIADLPPAIIVHAGPGVIAVSFFTKTV